jgi:hypothetical protein
MHNFSLTTSSGRPARRSTGSSTAVQACLVMLVRSTQAVVTNFSTLRAAAPATAVARSVTCWAGAMFAVHTTPPYSAVPAASARTRRADGGSTSITGTLLASVAARLRTRTVYWLTAPGLYEPGAAAIAMVSVAGRVGAVGSGIDVTPRAGIAAPEIIPPMTVGNSRILFSAMSPPRRYVSLVTCSDYCK